MKTKPFIVKYYLDGINYPSENDDWKKIEKNSLTITLNVLYGKKKKRILPTFQNKLKAWKTNYSFNDPALSKVALYSSKKLSALLRGMTTKCNGNFYHLNCLHSFKSKKI